jgi:uncharacterized peroxidase-related enzyme
MTYIKTIEPEDAEGTLKSVYGEFQSTYGAVPLFLRAMSLRPDVAATFSGSYRHLLLEQHELDRITKELIIVYVSKLNSCSYCHTAHAVMVSVSGEYTQDQLRCIMEDVEGSDLIHASTKAILHYARKVTQNAYKVTEDDIEHLRESGFSDEAILEATILISFYNMMNRSIGSMVRPGKAGRRGVKLCDELDETSFIVQRVRNPPGHG